MNDIKARYEAEKEKTSEDYLQEIKKLKETREQLKEEIGDMEGGHLKLRTKLEKETWKLVIKETVQNYTEMEKVTNQKGDEEVKLSKTSQDKTSGEQTIKQLEHEEEHKSG